jgi:hypothetical protein
MRNAYRDLVRKPEGKRQLEDPGIDGRVTGYNKMEPKKNRFSKCGLICLGQDMDQWWAAVNITEFSGRQIIS